jgi:hypothetical protein
MKFKNEWLSRNPHLLHCIHDQGPEFTSRPFQHVLMANGIKDVPTTVANPQSNTINEHLHQTIENTMRTMLSTFQPQNPVEAATIVDKLLCYCLVCCSFCCPSYTQCVSWCNGFPSQYVFPITLIADFEIIRQRCQAVVDDNCCRQNFHHLFHDCNVGVVVLSLNQNKNKPTLVPASICPFVIQQVHVNDRVTIIHAPNVLNKLIFSNLSISLSWRVRV